MWRNFFIRLATFSLIPFLIVGVIVKSAEDRKEYKSDKAKNAKKEELE